MTHAGELAHFLDEAVTQGCDLSKLDTLAPDELAAHWQEVLTFLRIVSKNGRSSSRPKTPSNPRSRRDQRLRALAAALAAAPPRAPVIAAGSTGSIPATAELLKVIAQLPTGAVVLPGLDTELDDRGVERARCGTCAIRPARSCSAHLGIEREDVAQWSPLPGERTERAAACDFSPKRCGRRRPQMRGAI